MMGDEIYKLLNESASFRKDCGFCKESRLEVREVTNYGATIVYKIGNSIKNGWFAALSPKTGGDPKKDFTIQLMSLGHLTHFSQISSYAELAKNYGTAFSKISEAVSKVISENDGLKADSDSKNLGISIAAYGKCTTWKEKKEHLHVKIFQFRGNPGQPYTVDSSFLKKEIHKDPKTGGEFVKMEPVKKTEIDKKRFNQLAKQLIHLLK